MESLNVIVNFITFATGEPARAFTTIAPSPDCKGGEIDCRLSYRALQENKMISLESSGTWDTFARPCLDYVPNTSFVRNEATKFPPLQTRPHLYSYIMHGAR